MRLKQVNIYYNDNTPAIFQHLFEPLQSLFAKHFYEEWSISREWTNGPHFRLLFNLDDFFFEPHFLDEAVALIQRFLQEYPAQALDKADYIEKQKKLMAIEKIELDPTDVRDNNSIHISEIDSADQISKYENVEQWLSIFKANCGVRRSLIAMRSSATDEDTQQKQLFDIMILLAVVYQPKVAPEADFGEYNGFLSYFSNYTFWHHSLPEKPAQKVKADFTKGYEQNKPKYADWLACLMHRLQAQEGGINHYASWIKSQFRLFTQMACEDVIHHRSPYPKEQLADINKVSSFHRKHFYTESGEGSSFPTDFSSYRWLLNIVYRFFPLLSFTPLDRQYFNYSLSRFELENREQIYQLREALYQA